MARQSRILITGGAGFIGTNLAASYLRDGYRVTLLDNLSRPGTIGNLQWLQGQFPEAVRFIQADVTDGRAVHDAVLDADSVYHFAAQVAVTTSLVDPLGDHRVNTEGTLNVLEAIRNSPHKPALVYTSTNKVYGSLNEIPLSKRPSRYEPEDSGLVASGVSERQHLDFHSPYGCSKGSADQYVIDYGRCFNLPTVVFRMSCICGPHQQGTEDQGWVAHFIRRMLAGEPITIYGDGRQVRDVLYVGDLVRAFRLLEKPSVAVQHRAFNIGGGPNQTTSVLELLDIVCGLTKCRPMVSFASARVGDQLWYVSDHSRFTEMTRWRPTVTVSESVKQMISWMTCEPAPGVNEIVEREPECALH
jgi:CDP-paratose 2-epimerase